MQQSQRSQRSYGNESTGIAAIVRVLRSQQSQRFYGNQSSAIVDDRMETEGGLYFGIGSKKFHYIFTIRFRNYFLGANVPLEIISLDVLVEMEVLAKINFIKQVKLLSMIPQIKI